MKKGFLITCSIILLSVISASAQKNTWIIDANGGYNNQAQGTPGPGQYPPLSLTSWSSNIAVGRQLSDHFAVGIIGGLGMHQVVGTSYFNGIPDYHKLNINTWNVGVYGRYTYWLNKRFFLYSQLSAVIYGYNVKENTHVNGNYPLVYSPYQSSTIPEGMSVNLIPAIGVNLVRGYGIHMDVGGISYTHGAYHSSNYNNINVNFGQQFSFGLHKIIGWKKMNSVPAKSPDMSNE